MAVIPDGRETVVRLLHDLKRLSPNDITDSGMTILVNPEQFWKAFDPIVVKVSGSWMPDSFVQPEKADSPILVILPSKTTLESLEQPEKAEFLIVLTAKGIHFHG